ncbi:hypothetical protein BJV82DRAFT_664303 [Fennellomyces sp. T-0311]|nr:hypothetical protein BJV82DRAFT_664303 [Fennellomyces sp. T-0311]
MNRHNGSGPHDGAAGSSRSAEHNGGDRSGHESGSDVFTAFMFKPTASSFSLKRRRASSAYIPNTAVRSKRIHAELEADQDFLHQMLDIWNAKLQQLQMDERILETMASIPESALQGARPLINQADYTKGFDLASQPSFSSHFSNNRQTRTQDASSDTPPECAEDDEEVYWDAQDTIDEDEDEDEDAARRALTFMLAEFGDQLE